MKSRSGRLSLPKTGVGLAVAAAVLIVALVVAVAVRPGAFSGERGSPASQDEADPDLSGLAPERIREPAVAGLFYPRDPKVLAQAIDGYLAKAKPEPVKNLRALICPHAGYEYSGPIAASAYKLLADQDRAAPAGKQGIRTVIILASSHYSGFAGASIPDKDAYRTPLGLVGISARAAKLAQVRPFLLEPRTGDRPGWWGESPKAAPPAGQDTPDTWEHSAEVQVPFLQKTLRNFRILPIVFGRADPEQAARGLADLLDEKTLIVASTDLSHHQPYDVATAMDQQCVTAICNLDLDAMRGRDEWACGKAGVETLMHIARRKGWKAKLLDYRNSGDTSGDKRRVVGYAAIAFHEPARADRASQPAAGAAQFSPAERKALLALARRTVTEVVTKNRLPTVDDAAQPAKFAELKGCFVTLTKKGQLRGCIGNIPPSRPLYKAVMENARSAAIHDSRFPRVGPDELDKIDIEVSVLTVPQPLAFAHNSPEDLLARLRPHIDGVLLRIPPGHDAVYLPQVWEQIPNKEMFLATLAQKAGCPADAWKRPGTTVHTYQVECFKESDE